jgi:membrane associated rhomboid family serine protease
MSNQIIKRPLPYAYKNVAFILIGINILVFVLTSAIPVAKIYLALVPGLVVGEGFIWQFLTYMFTHQGISHILFNMLGLFFFGAQVEQRMGSWEFLLFYLLTGMLAGVFSFMAYMLGGAYNTILLGASGAVFAVLLAFATFYPDAMIYIMGIIPVRAPYLVIGYTVIELFSQFMSINSGVAHLTHLAGFGFAFAYLAVRLGINPWKVFRGDRYGGGGGWYRH